MADTITGLILLVVAGVTSASFTLPMKFTHRWKWENTWFVWSIFALLVLPPTITFLTIPQIYDVYAHVGPGLVVTVLIFGAAWGITQVLFGLAVDAIGIALAFSIVPGISAALGSLIPLIELQPERIFSAAGVGVLTGVVLVLLGVLMCAFAGKRREALQANSPAIRRSHALGVIFALLSGTGAAMVNFGLAFGGRLVDSALKQGADPLWAPNAVWLPVMLAGAIPNLVYCFYLLRRNRTGSNFVEAGTRPYWFYALVMAAFWFGSTSLYGIACGKLGSWGTIIGWPVFMSLIVITSSISGIATGEWSNTGKHPLRIQIGGVAMLVVAVFILSTSTRWI